MNVGSGFKALRKLSQRQAMLADRQEMHRQVYAEENDRGACLLLSADIENTLDFIIEQMLDLSDEEVDELRRQEGPLGSFSRKISFASALRFIGPITKHNLTIIRHVRNAFAHAHIPLNFNAAEVVVVCNDFKLVTEWGGNAPILESQFATDATARHKFTEICNRMSLMMIGYVYFHDDHDKMPWKSLP